MNLQKNSFRTDLVLAAVLVTALLSVALFGLTYLVQRLVIPWYGKDAPVAEPKLVVDGLVRRIPARCRCWTGSRSTWRPASSSR